LNYFVFLVNLNLLVLFFLFCLLMSVFFLFFCSFFILVSSLSENFEFLVHNEESLLILCFISFIFFAYNFFGVTLFEGFNSKALTLESQLLSVVNTRFQALVSAFCDFLFSKGLTLRFQFISVLALYKSAFFWSSFGYNYTFLVNWLILSKLEVFLKIKSQVLNPIRLRLTNFVLSPFLFGASASYFNRYFWPNFSYLLVKNSLRLESPHFFNNLRFFKILYL